MQRHAALAVPFHARDFGAAEPPRTVDADAAGAEPHRRLHRALHGAAEGDAALELLRDRFGDELRVELGLPDLDDVDDEPQADRIDFLTHRSRSFRMPPPRPDAPRWSGWRTA